VAGEHSTTEPTLLAYICAVHVVNSRVPTAKTNPTKCSAQVVNLARLAQSVEHETLNLRVVGSSPTLGEKFFLHGTVFKKHI
jgi:hypothetical protein